jgi:hypothetical protein
MTDAGRPFFAMEFVPGVPLTTYCDDNRLTTRQRPELFIPVRRAVQHAPENWLVAHIIRREAEALINPTE